MTYRTIHNRAQSSPRSVKLWPGVDVAADDALEAGVVPSFNDLVNIGLALACKVLMGVECAGVDPSLFYGVRFFCPDPALPVTRSVIRPEGGAKEGGCYGPGPVMEPRNASGTPLASKSKTLRQEIRSRDLGGTTALSRAASAGLASPVPEPNALPIGASEPARERPPVHPLAAGESPKGQEPEPSGASEAAGLPSDPVAQFNAFEDAAIAAWNDLVVHAGAHPAKHTILVRRRIRVWTQRYGARPESLARMRRSMVRVNESLFLTGRKKTRVHPEGFFLSFAAFLNLDPEQSRITYQTIEGGERYRSSAKALKAAGRLEGRAAKLGFQAESLQRIGDAMASAAERGLANKPVTPSHWKPAHGERPRHTSAEKPAVHLSGPIPGQARPRESRPTTNTPAAERLWASMHLALAAELGGGDNERGAEAFNMWFRQAVPHIGEGGRGLRLVLPNGPVRDVVAAKYSEQISRAAAAAGVLGGVELDV